MQNGQDVVIIYTTSLGFIREHATFKEYRHLELGDIFHESPIFNFRDHEISGLDCFWLLPENAISDEQVLLAQKQLIPIQIKVLQISYELGYNIPLKIKDREIVKMAKENIDKINRLIEIYGFDPRDETWIENELAENPREKNWFQFERENGSEFSGNWEDTVQVFNRQFGDTISVEQAQNLSKKRTRYYLGSFDIRMSGDGNIKSWISSAKKFEETHRNRENRMLSWSLSRKNKFPLVKVVEPIRFWPGPYVHQILEKVPQLFENIDNPELSMRVKVETILRVISYDPIDKYMRLDFTKDVRKLIKPNEPENTNIWVKDKADYDFWLKKEQVGTHLEFLEPWKQPLSELFD